MFQLFLRVRAAKYFKTRSSNRDAETDCSRVSSIARSIEESLAEAERSGLNMRVSDVLARAATTFGNGDDEYLTRPDDGLEREFNFFNWLEGCVCTLCAPLDQGKSSDS